MTAKPQLTTFLWFNGNLDEALDFYTKTFDDVVIHSLNRPDPNGKLFTAQFSIFGHEITGMDSPGGPEFNDAISLSISCDGQDEVDRYWNALTERGTPGRCGWLVDEFGVSWQIIPRQLQQWLGNPDPQVARYAMQAMLQMNKIVIDELHA
jgi:predicted 3-demethylubiquinone-9 3-methyltransferase (glyoxalase superfamily)